MDSSGSGRSKEFSAKKDSSEKDDYNFKLQSDRLRWSYEDPMHNYMKLQKIRDSEERVKELQAMLESSSSSSESSRDKSDHSHRKHKKQKKAKDNKEKKRKLMWVEKEKHSNDDVKHSNSCKKRKKDRKEPKEYKSKEKSGSDFKSCDSRNLVSGSDREHEHRVTKDKHFQYSSKKIKHKGKRKSKHKKHSKAD